MNRFARVACGVLVGGALLVFSSALNAQQKGPPPKKGQAIEIRGQVPTPQVVTVRPREVPTYDRQLLAPGFYNETGSAASSAAVQLVSESQVRGTTALDTLPAVMAHNGAVPTVGPLAVHSDSMRNRRDTSVTRAGASTAEIEQMRHELALRRARLDSLQRMLALHTQSPVPLGKAPPPEVKRMSAADSAARVAEIESIRKELEYRKERLDSLKREVAKIGRRPAGPRKTTTDSTTAAPTTPRGRK